MKNLLWLMLFFISSCTPEIALKLAAKNKDSLKDNSYDLQVRNNSRLLYIYKTDVPHSVFGENNEIQIDTNVPANWDSQLLIGSYPLINDSVKTDRYYFLDSAENLYSTFDGITSTKITNFKTHNSGALSSFVSENGLFLTKILPEAGGIKFGDAFYFSVKRNVLERVVERLGLIDGVMPIYSSSIEDNFTEDYCSQNPGSCSPAPFSWIATVLMMENKKEAIGIVSKLVSISGAYYNIPYYTFKISDSSYALKKIEGINKRDLSIISSKLLLTSTERIFKDQSKISFMTDVLGEFSFFGINYSDLSFSKFGNFSGTLRSGKVYLDEDFGEEIIYPSLRFSQGGTEHFYFYYNNEWKNSPSLDGFLPNSSSDHSVKKDVKGGWNIGIGNAIFYCVEDLSDCQKYLTADSLKRFISSDGVFVVENDVFYKYSQGIEIKTFVFSDYSSGGNLLFQILLYREGSFVVIRLENGAKSKYNVYLLNKDLFLKEELTLLDSSKNGGMPTSDTPEEESFWLAHLKVMHGLNGIYFEEP